MDLENLKNQNQIISLDQLRRPEGLPTGISVLDDFLLWGGLPKGELSLFYGPPGTGATSLGIHTIRQVHQQNKWAAWVNSHWELFPASLSSREINLKKLLVIREPSETSKLFWILQELISSSLFEFIGCHLSKSFFKLHQLQKLKNLARTYKVSLILISPQRNFARSSFFQNLQSFFSLIIECQRDFFTVRRAAHRPTPFIIPGSHIYADISHQLSTTTRALVG